jgi:hypothetical protein
MVAKVEFVARLGHATDNKHCNTDYVYCAHPTHAMIVELRLRDAERWHRPASLDDAMIAALAQSAKKTTSCPRSLVI